MEFDAIGFIGLGAMGYHMALQLAQKLPEAQLFINDIDHSALARFRDEAPNGPRIHICSSAAEVGQHAATILTMVPEGTHVRQVYLAESKGLLAVDMSNKLLIDCSTIDVATTQQVWTEVCGRFPTAHFYDAPVSGGTSGAAQGTLTFMLGCSDDDPLLPRLRHMLGLLGKSIHTCGRPTAGVMTKLCNNYLSGLIAIAASEATNIGIRAGLDPRRLHAVFKTSTAQNAILDKFNPVPGVDPKALSSKGYEGGFKVQLMRKDFGLAVAAAKDVGATLALGEAGLRVYEGASEDERCRDRDSRVVYRFLGGIEDWEKVLQLKIGGTEEMPLTAVSRESGD